MALEADADIAEGEVVAAPAKRGIPRKLLIMAAAGLVVLLGAGAALYFFVFASNTTEQASRTAVVPDSFIFNLPPMTVNLSSDADGNAFLKLTIALEVADEKVMREIQPRMAKVVDAFQVYLRELRKSDLEGSAGIYRLKEELRRRVNLAIFPAQVEAILFKEILVQ